MKRKVFSSEEYRRYSSKRERYEVLREHHNNEENKVLLEEILARPVENPHKVTYCYFVKCFGKLIKVTEEEARRFESTGIEIIKK